MVHCCYFMLAIVSLFSFLVNPALAACTPPDCNGKGVCNAATDVCDCNVPFTGNGCEDRDPCKILDKTGVFVDRDCGAPIKGKCVPKPNDPLKSECQCNTGYFGSRCHILDNCYFDFNDNPWPPGRPCQNGGKCITDKEIINGILHYQSKCKCTIDKAGAFCHHNDPCHGKKHPCHGRGKCLVMFPNNDPVNMPFKACKCDFGYDAVTFCQIKDPCFVPSGTESVCKNGARCIIDRSTPNLAATCVCSANYDGPYCERVNKCGIPASQCHAASSKHDCNPCLNGGLCISTLQPLTNPIPNYMDTHIRVHSCDCTQTSFSGQFCEILRTAVIIIPADHKGPVGTAHVNSFEANSGQSHVYYIVALAFGDEMEIFVDTGDGFHFKLSLAAMKPIPEDLTILSAFRDFQGEIGEHSVLYYPLTYTYREGTYVMSVTISNGGTQSDQKMTNINAVVPANAKCVPYGKLKNVGHVKDLPTEYKRTDTFAIEASFMFDCYEDEWLTEIASQVEEEDRKFRFEWKLYKLTHIFPSPSAENDWHVHSLVDLNKKYLRFDQHVLLDGLYWVECRAYVKLDGMEYGNSELGFFRVNINAPRIVLRGGEHDRTEDGGREIILDASDSVDDSYPEHTPYLEYTWKCNPPCTEGPWEGSIVTIPEETFRYGSTIPISLLVQSPAAKTQSSASIIMHISHKSSVSLECIINCKWFNPGDEVIFICNHTDNGQPGPANKLIWTWDPPNEVIPSPVEDEPYMMSYVLPKVSTIVKRSLECYPQGSPGLKARSEFNINTPPVGGSCSISPSSGMYLITEFHITCSSFVDSNIPLEYTFYVEADKGNPRWEKLDNRLLLGHDTNPELDGVYLPFGNPMVKVMIQVTDDLGLFTETAIDVSVTLPPAGDLIRLFTELISGDNSLMKRRFIRGDYQGAMQLQMVGLYALESKTIVLPPGQLASALDSIEDKIQNTPHHSFKANEQVIYATHYLDHVESRADPAVLLGITRAVHEASSMLVEFAKDAHEVTSAAELETLADVVADSGSRLLRASSSQICAPNQQANLLLACNQRNVLDFDKKDDSNPDTYYEVIEDDLSVDEKQELGTVSESANLDVQECSKSGRNAMRAIRGALDGALGHLGVAVSFDTVTDSISARAQIMSQVESAASIALQTASTTIKDTKVNITIPGNTLEVMQQRVESDEAKLELQAITTIENAFRDDTSACPSTATVHFKVQDSDSHVPVTLKKLVEPIEVSLPILKQITQGELDVGKSMDQEVEIMALDELNDYYELPTYQMHLPHNSQIVVKIEDKSSDSMIFKVLPMKGRRAVFSDFCGSGQAIDIDEYTDTAVFLTDSIGLNEEPEEPYIDYHISILVFDFHNIHRREKFSVVFTRYSCIFRDEDRKFWSEVGCMVSNDITMDSTSFSSVIPTPMHLSRMKCLCNHASTIAGVQFVIPHVLDHSNLLSVVTVEEIENNPVVLTVSCLLLFFYLVSLIICRCFDIRDSNQDVGLTIMANLKVKHEGTRFYLITVVTGCNFWAGTTSSVSIVMYGSAGRSKVFTLKDRSNTVFLRGDIDTFLVSCEKDLGTLEKIRIWTDHTGVDPAWYCRKILIRSVNPDQIWYFYINRWLTVTAEESSVILEIPATTKEERKLFSVRFRENLLEQIDNVNLWFSIFRYSPANNFTRCQRLSCAFAVLTSYLLIDIWFYGTPTEDEDGLFDFGDYTFDLFAAIKAFEVVLIALPVGIILITLFRNIRSRFTPTLIIWENAVPAAVPRDKRLSIYFPSKEDEKPGDRGRKVKLPEAGTDPKVFVFESVSDEEDHEGLVSENEIDLKIHPDKLDRMSKASTPSKFSIPSTDVPQLEGWIQDRVDEDQESGVHSGMESDDHSKTGGNPKSEQYPFVQSLDTKPTEGNEVYDADTIARLGRRAIIHSVRDYDPDAFIIKGDHGVISVENIIDEQIRANSLRGSKDNAGDEEDMNKKEIILGQNKEDEQPKPKPEFKKVGDKTPWKKAVTTEYLQNIDKTLEEEQKNKQFLQDKANYEGQIGLEMCRLGVDMSRRPFLSWPWWTIFIAWALCFFTIVISLCFTILFGLHYGFLRSLKWLETLFYSIVISVFVIQPLNALIFTTFSTLLGKRQKVKERLQVIIEDTKSVAPYLKSRLPYKFNVFNPIRTCEPLRGNAIFRLTIEGRRRKELRGKLTRLVLCILLLIPLIAVSYSGHNHYNYEVTNNIRNIFQLNELGRARFQSEESVYTYLEDVVVHNLHPSRLYNGQYIPANSPALLSDQQTLLIGVGRIRQQRVKSSECLPPVGASNSFTKPTASLCNKNFRKSTQDREIYNPLWAPINTASSIPRYPTSLTNDGWVFHKANSEKTKSLTFHGQQGTYDGGGYILDMGRTRQQSISVIKYMRRTNWLDHRTRAIFLELTLMNPNINKFADVVILIEQGATGSFTLSSWISPIELIPIEDLQKSDEIGWVSFSIVAIIVILFLWICVFLYEQLNTPKDLRLRQPGFWLDLIIIMFVFISLCISLVRFIAAKEFADLIETQKVDEYVSIQSAAYWNDIQRAMFSVTQAFVFIKFWKLFMFTDQRFLTFALTLKLTSNYMICFIVALVIMLIAFTSFGLFLFGQDLWEFSTWGESMVSLVDQILGARFFKRFIEIDHILGAAFAFLFGYFVMFLGLNFVIALLDLGVHEAKEVVRQRRVWLTYFRYFKETVLKSLVFVSAAKKQELALVLSNKAAASATIHPDRMHGMKMATAAYIREFLVASKANKMKEMQMHCNKLLAGTGYKMISRRQKAADKEQEKQQHIDQLRRMTSSYIQEKLGHEMKPKEFKEYADVNKYIVKLRVEKMEKKMENLVARMDEFLLRHS